MKDCKRTTRNLVAFLYGELDKNEKQRTEDHLETCQMCKQGLQELKKLSETADLLNADMEEAMESVDWESLPARIAGDVFDNESPQDRRKRRVGLCGSNKHTRAWSQCDHRIGVARPCPQSMEH